MQHPKKKRNILLTVKDLNRHKHAIQIDKIQTGDTSNNILIIQARELQNLMQRKKKRKQSESKDTIQTTSEGKSASPGMGRVPTHFPLVREIGDKGT